MERKTFWGEWCKNFTYDSNKNKVEVTTDIQDIGNKTIFLIL
jgi:hypothetical protein